MKIIIEHDGVDYDATHLLNMTQATIDELIDETQNLARKCDCPLSDLNIRFVDK